MRRGWLLGVAAGLSMLLVVSAAAQEGCTPVPPKKWEGTLKVGSGGWIGGTTFSQGRCSWGPAEALNGGDVIIWDVSGYGGLSASISSKQANDAVYFALQGYFYDDECRRGGAWGFTEANTPYTVGIPERAQWIVILQEYGGTNTQVAMETAGRVCVEEVAPTAPPKKKKKPRRP